MTHTTYARTVWLPTDIIEIRPLKPNQGERVWTYARDIDGHIPRMITENERGANMYAGILPRNKFGYHDGQRWVGGRAEDVDGGRVLWVDMDNIAAEQAIELSGGLGMPMPTMTVATGHGAHLYWKLKEWLPRDEISRVLAGLVAYLKTQPTVADYVDVSAKDPARILRLPGFINHKPPVAMARIVCVDPDGVHDLDEFAPFMLEQPVAPAPTTTLRPPPQGDLALERARRYLAMVDGTGKGGRTNNAFRAASVIINDIGGVSDNDAIALLTAWDSAANTPSIAQDYGPDEITKIVENAHRYAKKPAGCLNTARPITPVVAVDDGDVDLSGILSKRVTVEHAWMPSKFLEMPGLPGEVMRFNLDTAPKPQPILALAGALALQALLCSRKLTDEYGTRPNMHICSIAPAGAGKDHARQLNKRILNELGMTDNLTIKNFEGEEVTAFKGIPIRQCDAILDTEPPVTA